MNFTGESELTKKWLLPTKILLKRGCVEHEKSLFAAKQPQISLAEPDCAVLSNRGGGNAMLLLDFGTEISGGVRILTHFIGGEKTPLVRLTFGESAAEAMSGIGEKNATDDHAVRDMTVKLTALSDMEFGQTGFRFVRIELLSGHTSVRIKSIYGCLTYRELEYQGSFVCSDPRLNTIYDVCAYTCHLNMQNFLWDGIKRDRLVWVGDMHPEMLTVRTVFGPHPIVADSLRLAVREYPLPGYPNGMITYAMWWLILARDWYFYTGDPSLIRGESGYITGLLTDLCGKIDDDGGDHPGDDEMSHFLDWPTHGAKEEPAGGRAIFSMALGAGAALCCLLGQPELARLCEDRRRVLNARIPREYGTKAVAAAMVAAGQLDAGATAREILLPGGAKGMSTFMSYYILTALARAGKMTEALDILRQYYGGMLDAGATAFWEDFDVGWLRAGASIDKLPEKGGYDIHGDNGAFCYSGYRHSLCHGWASAPAAFLAERVLGVRIAEAGCKTVRIDPDLGGLDWAKGTFPTPRGVISVAHTRRPDGTVATEYILPSGVLIAGSGEDKA